MVIHTQEEDAGTCPGNAQLSFGALGAATFRGASKSLT
jgi:hypothetical protein